MSLKRQYKIQKIRMFKMKGGKVKVKEGIEAKTIEYYWFKKHIDSVHSDKGYDWLSFTKFVLRSHKGTYWGCSKCSRSYLNVKNVAWDVQDYDSRCQSPPPIITDFHQNRKWLGVKFRNHRLSCHVMTQQGHTNQETSTVSNALRFRWQFVY